ncbi:helix-turn-helix transcriptional regulator [Nocardiopsis sp. CT-R113]|uniref:Helix-turn-helix transcriptional regulator n=1 Tax=Nocardiopsis codii TaxID=3065942 RepID=A0ABU7K1C3_9ACTN|nr:helix-turn-helix transcriptional regulator [Nocardiopsis sp. CT-R113]MEE2035857.1 helix-turn-helix transcriptional regulator [Nocardiopsis sp. CT-R113]
MLLGHELRKRREQRGITREDAGNRIRASASKISRMELGRVGFKLRDIEDLLKMYGVSDRKTIKELLEVARESNKPGWWKEYGDSLHKWFIRYVGFEEAADHIRIYESQFVPGLLQTEEYAREIISGGVETDMVTEQRIEARLRRQKRVENDTNMRMWVILDEAAVRRPIGVISRGPEIMRRQIEHLIHLSSCHDNITLQIIPFSVGAHAAEAGSFTLLRYSEFELADMVYLEQLHDGELIDRRNVVEAYTKAMTRLSVAAATPDETLDMLKEILEDLK